MNDALQFPGLANAWTMPIKGRIDMLSTGLRTPVGIKISGNNVEKIEEIGAQVEALLPAVKGTRSVFAERTGSGSFLDFEWRREELARYGLSIEEAQEVVASAIGGENVTTTIEGRERYPVNVQIHARFQGRHGDAGSRPGGRLRGPEANPLVGARRNPRSHRSIDDPGRGRLADRLRLSRHCRPGPEKLHRRGGKTDPGKDQAAHRL